MLKSRTRWRQTAIESRPVLGRCPKHVATIGIMLMGVKLAMIFRFPAPYMIVIKKISNGDARNVQPVYFQAIDKVMAWLHGFL
ncbi:hypothetical protein MRB53_035615 [Persea americana]|uniref:Uncharacterized protein n=1 Tax=Persea americana TaxID=3435 RepID=A0ACC2K5S0_PERAE|nr:hypothetical protein MRB53_035615 [Persea americana]